RLTEEGEAAGCRIDPIQRLDPRHDAVDPAVAFLVEHGGAPAEPVVDERPAHRGLRLEEAVVAAGEYRVAIVVGETRVAGIEIPRPAGCVLAVQSALRAAQHLDTIEVVDLQ